MPGAWLGNSPMDLIRDCQAVCNAAARALVNNMGIASGPGSGSTSTACRKVKIADVPVENLAVLSDMANNSAPPVDFFSRTRSPPELMTIYERFPTSRTTTPGIPRYLTGGESPGGAGRTASGMSMMMNNAGKAIKQVISNIDRYVIQPAVERLWMWNMRYSDDRTSRGDVKVVAKGANALVVKEAAAQRRRDDADRAHQPDGPADHGVEGVAALYCASRPRRSTRTPTGSSPARDRQGPCNGGSGAGDDPAGSDGAAGMLMQPLRDRAARRRPGPTTDSGNAWRMAHPVTDTFSPMRTSKK